MKFIFGKVVVFALIAAFALGLTPAVQAQSGDYVNTLSLPATPATDGTYKGVDPSNAKLTFWYNYSGSTADAMNAQIDKFNKANPWHITLTGKAKGSYPVIYQAILAGLQTKDLPNLTVAYQNEAATYETADALVKLDDLVNDKTYGFGEKGLADFFPGFLAQDVNPQFNNARLGFALYRSAEVLYYNVDALKALGYDAPPKSWDQFKEMTCKFAKSGSGKIGYEVRTDASWVAAATFAQGGDIYDPKTNKLTYNTAEAEVGPQTMADLLKQGCVSLIANSKGFSDQADFGAGKALFYGGSTSGIPFIGKAISDAKQNFKFDVAPIPYKDHPVTNIYGASVSIVHSTPENDLATWLFIRWFSESDQQAAWATASNYFPARKSAADKLGDLFTKLPAYKSAFDLLSQGTKAEPPLAGYNPIRQKAADAMADVLDGKDVKARFTQLNTDANKLLQDFKPNLIPNTPVPATAVATPK